MGRNNRGCWIRQCALLAAAATLIVILGANRSSAQQTPGPEESRPTNEKQQAVIDHLLRRKQEEGWRFDVGRTRVLAYKDLEITGSVSGLPSPNDLQSRRALALQSMRLYERAKRKAGINDAGQDRRNCRPDAGAFSWREAGKVTPPRDQVIEGLGGACAACWAFAPIGAYESSYLIENNLRADMSPAPVDASEQMLVSCTPKSGCTLGHVTKAMDLLVWNGTTSRTELGYFGSDGCVRPSPVIYHAIAWMPLSLNAHRVISPQRIKAALCAHGPVTTRLIVTNAFKAYQGGIYHQVRGDKLSVTDPGAHQVLIVGWDDSKGAWLIKNSWVQHSESGKPWGLVDEGLAGYGWIEYGANLIGHHTNAIQAFHQAIPLAALGKKYAHLKSKYLGPNTVRPDCSCPTP